MEIIQKTQQSQKNMHQHKQKDYPRLSTREEDQPSDLSAQIVREISAMSCPEIEISKQTIINKDSQEEAVKYCRICLEGEMGGSKLLSPCSCSNCVHDTCLLDWLRHREQLKNKTSHNCQICLQRYRIEIQESYCWTFEVCKGENTSYIPSFIFHLLVFIVLSTVIALTVFFCFKLNSSSTFVERVQNLSNLPLNTLLSLSVMVVIVFGVFTIFWGCRMMHRFCYGVAVVLRERSVS